MIYIFVALIIQVNFKTQVNAAGVNYNTLINAKNLQLNAENFVFAVIDTSLYNPDTYVSAIYGLKWTDTYSANPIQSNIQYARPGDTIVYTYKFVNNANAPDTIIIELSEPSLNNLTLNDWNAAIFNADNTIKLGDTVAIITNLAADEEFTFNIVINISAAAVNLSSGGCSVVVKTNSAPVGQYIGDNSQIYAGSALISDIDDGETANVLIKYPKITITQPTNNSNVHNQNFVVSGTSAFTRSGDNIKIFVNSQLQQEISITDTSTVWSKQININSYSNVIEAKLYDSFGRLFDTSIINVNYTTANPFSLYFYQPTINAIVIETNAAIINLQGYCSEVFENIDIFMNGNYLATAQVSHLNIWQTQIPLNSLADSRILNLIEARPQNSLLNNYYDTIAVYCDLEKPAAINNALITKYVDVRNNYNPVIYLNWQKLSDDIAYYNIYRYSPNGLYLKSVVYTENFVDNNAQYDADYVYFIEPVDRVGNIGDSMPSRFEISNISKLSDIKQIAINIKNNSGLYSLELALQNAEGEILNCFDGNTIAIRLTNPNAKISFDTHQKTMQNGKVEFFISGLIGIMPELFKFTFSGKEYHGLLIFKLDENDTMPPKAFVSDIQDSSFALVAIPYYYYEKISADTEVLVSITPEPDFDAVLNNKKNQANIKLENSTDYKTFNTLSGGRLSTIKQFEITKRNGEKITNFGNNFVHLFISYPDDDNDLIVDFTKTLTTTGVNANTIDFLYLNEITNSWDVIPFTVVDTTNKVVRTKVNHFSTFMIAGKSYSLSDIINNLKVYPNPFKPNSDPTHTQIIFDNVNPGSRLRIFTITGQLVYETTADANQYRIIWNVVNQHNKPLASGIYIYLIEYRTLKNTGKLLIIK